MKQKNTNSTFRYFDIRIPVVVAALLFAGSRTSRGDGLTDILRRVEEQGPILHAARAEAQAQAAGVRVERSRYLGEVDVFLRDSHFNDPRLIRTITTPIDLQTLVFDDNQVGYGLSAHVPIDVNGRIGARVKAARHQELASDQDTSAVRLDLFRSASHLYRGMERLVGRRSALGTQAESLEAHVRVAESAIRVGRVARVEGLRLRAELQGVRSRLAELDGIETELRARLAALMGVSRFDAPVETSNDPPRPLETSESVIRPDVEAAKARVGAAGASVRAARAERLPTLSVAGGWSRNRGYGTDAVSTWQIGLLAQMPVWDGGSRGASEARARERERAATHRLAALEDLSRAEIAAARGKWNAAKASYEATSSGVRVAEETARIQRARFDAGRLSAADLVDAESALASARSDLTTNLADWWEADDTLRIAQGHPPAAYQGAGPEEVR